MQKTIRVPMVCALLLLPGVLLPGERFDGKWLTTVTCPSKGKTQGYKIELPSVIKDGAFRGERGVAGEPGYLLIEGKIANNGAAKLSATGKVSSREYATGILTTQGADYSYNIKAQFQDTHGTGTRDKGLGIVGRACPVEFVKQ
jgi:hypothetical protein